jgi:hypothetical protein
MKVVQSHERLIDDTRVELSMVDGWRFLPIVFGGSGRGCAVHVGTTQLLTDPKRSQTKIG